MLVVLTNTPRGGISRVQTLTRMLGVTLPQPAASPEQWEHLRFDVDQCAPRIAPFFLQLCQDIGIIADELKSLTAEFLTVLGGPFSRTAQNAAAAVVATIWVVRATLGEEEAAAMKTWALLHWSKVLLHALNAPAGTGALFRRV